MDPENGVNIKSNCDLIMLSISIWCPILLNHKASGVLCQHQLQLWSKVSSSSHCFLSMFCETLSAWYRRYIVDELSSYDFGTMARRHLEDQLVYHITKDNISMCLGFKLFNKITKNRFSCLATAEQVTAKMLTKIQPSELFFCLTGSWKNNHKIRHLKNWVLLGLYCS